MGIYEVSVEHSFTARHAIRLADGTLEDPHEHLWRVTATFRADALDETTGIVIDFAEVQEAMRSIASELEGTDLNEVLPFRDGGASAERIAEFLGNKLVERMNVAGKLYRVGVTEAEGCSARFYPGGGPSKSGA